MKAATIAAEIAKADNVILRTSRRDIAIPYVE
jgi:hypothetical protein